jgi:hypothetical protein
MKLDQLQERMRENAVDVLNAAVKFAFSLTTLTGKDELVYIRYAKGMFYLHWYTQSVEPYFSGTKDECIDKLVSQFDVRPFLGISIHNTGA